MMYESMPQWYWIFIFFTERKSNKIDSTKEFVLFDVKNLFDFINQINVTIVYLLDGGPANISSINKCFLLKAEPCTRGKEH